MWDQCLWRGANQGSHQTQFSTYYLLMKNFALWLSLIKTNQIRMFHWGLASHHPGDATVNNIDPTTKTLRIWKILSLHESTHLIGKKYIQIRIGKKEEAEEDSKVLCTQWLPEPSSHFIARLEFCHSGEREGSEGKDREKQHSHTTGALSDSSLGHPGHTHCLSWRRKIAKRAFGPPKASLRVNTDLFREMFFDKLPQTAAFKPQPTSFHPF